MTLTDPGGNGADADFADQLDGDISFGIAVLQVKNQLRQIFDRIDVVMRRRRNQGDAGNAVTQFTDVLADLVTGQLSALAGLGALGDLDLQLIGIHQVVRRDPEAARSDLLDGAAPQVAIGVRSVTTRVLAPLAGI